MTKKSYGRLQRDNAQKELEKTRAWDDLMQIYNDCVATLGAHAHLARAANDEMLLMRIENKATLLTNLNLLKRDLLQLSDELKQLHDKHASRTGAANDVDDHWYSIQLYEQYALWMQKHEAVVMPTVYHLVEQIQAAERQLVLEQNAERQAEAVRDVNVVTDVLVKPASTVDASA